MKRYLIAIVLAIMMINMIPAFAQASTPITASEAVQQYRDDTEFSNIHLKLWEKVAISIIATIVCIHMWNKEQEDE